jgi:hypothetical protein
VNHFSRPVGVVTASFQRRMIGQISNEPVEFLILIKQNKILPPKMDARFFAVVQLDDVDEVVFGVACD